MDKAEKFALMRQQVAMVNPGLDETIENPVTTIARTARRDEQESEQSKILSDLSKSVGIYYFFKSDCPYCAKQNITLVDLRKRYGFSIMPISVDGQAMPDGIFTEWTPDRGQASILGIESTPTLYLVKPPNEVVMLSVGVQTTQGLEKRVLQVAHANKWIDDDTFERAMRGLPRRFLVDALDDMQGVDWSDPQAALNALRYASSRGTEKATVDEVFRNAEATSLQP
jgi:conjugal transfer pilus assembly protein TraF